MDRRYISWLLVLVVSFLALYVWGSSFGWDARAINPYLFFPMLGLLAFSIMWSHYVVGFLMNNYLSEVNLASYFRATEYVVLACIVLHPSILIYQRFRDGYGLPPGSYQTYVAPMMAWLTLLGSVSLLVFLAFELHRWFGEKPWWKYVLAAGDLAMLAVFYHGLRLGSQLQGGWYHYVWLLYGAVLVAILGYKYGSAVRRRL